jgi:glutaconate CoA-transferase, subunit A
MSLKEAIGSLVRPGDAVFFSGMQHGEPAAAIREIIRQQKGGLTILPCLTTLAGLLVGEGLTDRVYFGYMAELFEKKFGYPAAKARENRTYPILEEYSHFGFAMALMAGQMGVPYLPTRVLLGSDVERHNRNITRTQCPFTGEMLGAVKAINPDVAIVHVQICDEAGNAQKWGSLGIDRLGINAASVVVVTTERIVPTSVIRENPNRTIIPGFRVRAVVEEPWGAFPVHLAGCYHHDMVDFRNRMKTKESYEEYLQTYVYGVRDQAEFLKMTMAWRGADFFDRLKVNSSDQKTL